MATTIEDVLALDDGHTEVVKVPEWGDVEITVASMTARERSEIEKRWGSKDASSDPASFRADVLAQTLKKPDKTPFGTPQQIQALLDKNAAAVERLFEAACEVNGFTKKDVEELEKN